jgi:hypothetical protein
MRELLVGLGCLVLVFVGGLAFVYELTKDVRWVVGVGAFMVIAGVVSLIPGVSSQFQGKPSAGLMPVDLSAEPERPSTMVDRELSREGDSILRQALGEAFKNVEIEDTAGTRRLLMVRFPRVKSAVWAAVISIVTVGAAVLALISSRAEDGAAIAAGLIAFVVFIGVYIVQILIIAVRGGFFALTPTGLLVNTGLTSVFVPWTAIGSAAADVLDSRSRSPVLRVLLKGGSSVPGWPWTTTFLVVLFGSSRSDVRIMAWWFQPVPLDRIVETIRHLVSHPEDRARIGRADPESWLVDWSPSESPLHN